MLPIAFGVTWAGYGLTSWGYCLLKGWNIGFGDWFNPVRPWEWTAENAATPPLIPPTKVNPAPPLEKEAGGSAGKIQGPTSRAQAL